MLSGINHITVAVSDVDHSLSFYVDQLGMTAHVKWDRGAYLTLGDAWFCLSLDDVSPAADYSHISLTISEQDFAAFADMLRAQNIREWKQNVSEGNSLYILDPDGHKLEIHSGNLESRLEALRKHPYDGLEWL